MTCQSLIISIFHKMCCIHARLALVKLNRKCTALYSYVNKEKATNYTQQKQCRGEQKKVLILLKFTFMFILVFVGFNLKIYRVFLVAFVIQN